MATKLVHARFSRANVPRNMGATASCGKPVNQEVPAFKIVLIGDPEVGKSSIFLRYTKNQFDYSYQPSINVSIGNVVKSVNVPYDTIVSVTLWDLPGREEMDLRRSYYKDVDAAIVVVDMDDLDSITMAGTWKQDFVNNAIFTEDKKVALNGKADPRFVPALLIGNKADKLKYQRDDDSANEDEEEDQLDHSRIRCLEEIALQHGFVGSVTVSAKANDRSVHVAIQSLIRHLLQQRMKQKRLQAKGGLFSKEDEQEDKKFVTISPLEKKEDKFVPLIKVKIPEYDVFFNECNPPIETVETMSTALLEAMDLFKRQCSVAGVTNRGKATLEECISGLKELVRTEDDEDGLELQEDGAYVKLVIKENEVNTIPGPVQRVIKTFHSEVCAVSKKVLVQCPGARNKLLEMDGQLRQLGGNVFERAQASGMTQRHAKAAVLNVEANLKRIQEASYMAMETMTAVDSGYKKIKAAMLW